MENLTIRMLLAGGFFLLMLLSGILLSRKGKPYHKILFAVHKIVTLLTLVFLIRLVLLATRTVSIVHLTVTLFWVSGAFFILSFVSGALLSFEKPMPEALVKFHRLTALLVTFLVGTTFYLLIR